MSFGFNNKIIVNKPAGYYGFYTLGITSYIKNNYNLDDYNFIGSSAGAWNSLYSVYKGSSEIFIESILEDIDSLKVSTLNDVQKCLKKNILQNTKTEDYDFSRLYIGVTVAKKLNDIQPIVYNNFESLEDAIDCCIASSHIPFITGGLVNKYKNLISFDGGISNFNNNILIEDMEIWFEINAGLWNNNPELYGDIEKTSSTILQKAFYPKKFELLASNLYNAGLQDTCKNKKALDCIFTPIENI
jgi:hypothetical protein|tara:strand:- start:3110 stop:3841 length:732 start_codon:yes stop_codon:yes gene_type:complete